MIKKRTLAGTVILPFVLWAQQDTGTVVVADSPEGHPSGVERKAELPPDAGAVAAAESTVIVAEGDSLLEATSAVIGQVPDRVLSLELLSETEAASLAASTNRFGTAAKRIPWNKALEEVLRPASLGIFDDGAVVKIGSRAKVDALYAAQQTERLAANHTRIDPDFSGGTEIYVALSTIRTMAGVNMNFDYMSPEHRGIVRATATEQASDGKVQVPAQQPVRTQTTYAVPLGQKIEWRVVLKEVLDPIGYTFIEDNGTVKPMPVAQLVKFNQDKINAKPLVTKFVRVHHAKSDTILEKLKKMNLIRHAQGFIDVSQGKDDKARIYQGQAAGIATGSGGQQIGMRMQSSSSSFDSLVRQSTPPGLIIADIEENIPVIEESIRMLDVRESQVLIEALILDLSEQTALDLGVKWGDLGISYNSQMAMNRPHTFTAVGENGEVTWQTTTTSDGKTITLNKPVTTTRIPQDGDLTSPVNLEDWAGKIAKDRFSAMPISFDAVLKMVQEDKFSKLLSNPTLTVGDHCDAAIQVGVVTPVEQVSVNYVGSGSQSPISAQSVEWLSLQTGILLWVSPEISKDGKFVRLAVHPQITDVVGDPIVSSTGQLNYKVATQELDTRVTVPTGQTIMLGGLIRPSTGKTVSKVPWLGDIPYLGRLFRYTSTGTDSRHLVLLIRPTILDDNAPDTGYEKPALNVAEPMLKRLGKDLHPDFGAYHPEEKEKELLGLKKKNKKTQAPESVQPTTNTAEQVTSVEIPAENLSLIRPAPAVAEPAAAADPTPAVEKNAQPSQNPSAEAAAPAQAKAEGAAPAAVAEPGVPAAEPKRDPPLVVPSDK